MQSRTHSTRFLSGLVALGLGLTMLAGPVAAADDDAKLKRLDERAQAFSAAFMAGDADSLAGLLAPHYHHTNNSARALDREGWLATMEARMANIEAGRLVTTEYRTEESERVVHGDTAVVTGLAFMSGVRDQNPFAMRIRYTNVWAWDGDDWYRVAFHDTYEFLDP
jgi:ketosteroid isomerase-like protein